MLGALAGVIGLIMPVLGLILAAVITVLALLRAPREFGLGGVWLGFGGTWTFFLGRAGIECLAAPPTSDGCGSPMFQAYLVVGVLMAAAGLLVTASAFRGRAAG
jgi:hypothetical protein